MERLWIPPSQTAVLPTDILAYGCVPPSMSESFAGVVVCLFSFHQTYVWSRDELLNNPDSFNKIVLRNKHLHAARDGIRDHPPQKFILKHGLDTIAFQ